jgi:hypothetical protein
MSIEDKTYEFNIVRVCCYSCRDCSEEHPNEFLRVLDVITPTQLYSTKPSDEYIQQVESSCPYGAIRFQER